MLDRELFDLLEHTADATFVLTDSGEICSWNASAEALFGYRREEVLGRTCFELLQGTGEHGVRVCTERCGVRECAARNESIPDFDLEVCTARGDRVWVNISTLVHVDDATGRRRIVHMARSIAGRKRTEQLIDRMLRLSREIADTAADRPRRAPVATLSEQERRVLRLLSDGSSPASVAAALRISPQTLRNHLHRINQKLGTQTRLQAVMHAMRRQLI